MQNFKEVAAGLLSYFILPQSTPTLLHKLANARFDLLLTNHYTYKVLAIKSLENHHQSSISQSSFKIEDKACAANFQRLKLPCCLEASAMQ